MAQKILIDLVKMRSAIVAKSDISLPEALFYDSPNNNGLKTIRELAIFKFTCRKCEEAPCIKVCPADALEKNAEGVISRYTNLCISCKSCVTICPFGTMMNDFFKHHLNKENYFDITEQKELELFIKACPEGTVSYVDMDENPDQHIYKLNENILIKEFIWDSDIL